MVEKPPDIRSAQFGGAPLRDYRAEQIGEILIERVVWGDANVRFDDGTTIVAPGYIWFRFWLPRLQQVIERYYTAEGALVGTLVDVCMPPHQDGQEYRAADLILDLWIQPDGRVTLHKEDCFEAAVRDGALSPGEAEHAERHLRELTSAIALQRFPPALVRNWQVDPQSIKQ